MGPVFEHGFVDALRLSQMVALIIRNAGVEDLVLRFGLDALPEPARRLSEPGRPLDPLERSPASAGALRRIELEKLLNPGDRS